MPTFLDNLLDYNAKASVVILQATRDGQPDRANMMSALKTTANDISLSEETRLNALTALINMGNLLTIPLPPYFPVNTTYSNVQTYVGVHNDLTGLQGGDPIANEFLHLTQAEKDSIATKATLNDITFGNLSGFVSQNSPLVSEFALKQDALNGNGFVVASGGTISYDANTYLQNINNIQAGGDLVGYYPNPTISNGSIINQILNGFNNTAAWSAVTASDSILSAIEKLNAYAVAAAALPAGVDDVALTLPASVFSFTGTPATGSVMLSGSFINQSQNTFFAGPDSGGSGTPQFRTISANDLPTTGIGTGTVGATTLIPVISYDDYGRITNVASVSSTGGGAVNTVDFSVPAGGIYDKTIGGTAADPVINFSILPQAPYYVYAGPNSGALDGVPSFRPLVPNDIPSNIPQTKITGLTSALNSKLSNVLATSSIYLGNGSGRAVQAKVGGDLSALYTFPDNDAVADFTIKNKAVTYAKFADVPDSAGNTIRPILLGRFSSGQGPMEQMTLDPLAFNYNVVSGEIGLVVPNPPALTDQGDLLTSSGFNNLERLGLPVDYSTKGYLLVPYVGTTAPDIKLMWGEAKGDITYSIDTTTTPGTPFPNFVIGANKVTLGKIQTIATNTILGNNGLLGASPIQLTPDDVVDMLPLQNATTGLTKGVVPASGFTPAAGKSKTDYYLSANNSWELAGAGGGSPAGTGNEVQYRLNSTTFGAIPYMSFDSPLGEIRTVGSNFLLVDDVTTVAKSVYFDLSLVNSTGLSWAFPDFTDTFVGEQGAQNLTNKVLSTNTAINVGTTDVGTIWYSNDTIGTLTTLTASGNQGKYLRVNAAGTALEWAGAGSGSGTVGNGNQYQLAYYNGAGTTTSVIGWTAPTSNRALVSNGNGLPAASSVTDTELGYVSGVTSAIQTQLNGKEPTITTLAVNKGGTGAATLTGLLRGTGTTAITGAATVALGSEVSGTLSVANGGTGQTTYTNGQLLIGNTTGNTLTKATLTQGSGITITNGAGSITIASSASAPTLNQLQAATAANTPINSANFAQEWQWNTLAGGNGFFLSSTSTAAASNTQTLFRVGLSGINANSTQSTFASIISNTHTGTNNTNYALRLTASGGTTNYALDVTSGIVAMSAGTAGSPQLIMTPSNALSFSGLVNGSLWYDTASSNSSLTLYKDTGYTKIITKDRNPDFATGSASGVLVADTSGTITKSADLTALGIFSGTADGATLAASGNADLLPTSVVGSKTLPANFFGVGKTIEVFVSGKITTTNSPGNLVLKLQLGATPTDIVTITLALHASMTNAYWDAKFTVVCRTTGATGNISANGVARMETNTGANIVYADAIVPTTLPTINTANAQDVKVNGAITVANSVTVQNCHAIYLN